MTFRPPPRYLFSFGYLLEGISSAACEPIFGNSAISSTDSDSLCDLFFARVADALTGVRFVRAVENSEYRNRPTRFSDALGAIMFGPVIYRMIEL